MKYYVTIGVSVDRYHVGYDPKDALEYYKKELKVYAKASGSSWNSSSALIYGLVACINWDNGM